MRMFSKSRLPAPAIAAALAVFGLNGAANSIDMGNASVMSMQGQRLKIAIPYGSSPGEKVTVLRFSIDSISGDGAKDGLVASDFVISQPEFRNVIYLQSRDPVAVTNVRLMLGVADNPAHQVAYDLVVPPLKFAQTQLDAASAKKPVAKRAKRKSTAKNNAKSGAAAMARPKASNVLTPATRN